MKLKLLTNNLKCRFDKTKICHDGSTKISLAQYGSHLSGANTYVVKIRVNFGFDKGSACIEADFEIRRCEFEMKNLANQSQLSSFFS